MSSPASILLTTLNARYMHTAFGLRYLFANMGALQPQTEIIEFTIQEQALTVVEKLLERQPKIVGLSVYIWNVSEVLHVVSVLKQVAPDVMVVLGGPEVSHYPDVPRVATLADYVISGAGEVSFPVLCERLLSGNPPDNKFIEGKIQPLDEIALPYEYYSDEDIRTRLIYVEASRGCPFKCEFCLSALDKSVTAFPLEPFFEAMEKLLQRGVRNFKFIDRTFNLKIATSVAILAFFLDHMTDDLYLHFEVVPDNLPDKLKTVLQRFPANSLQFEIGVQTFDEEIQTLISRRQNNQKTKDNIVWLREHTGAHLHTDLIFGLPSDSLINFGDSFNQLIALNPHEIQMGILKRLRGAPLNRHDAHYQLNYNPEAPYNILSTRDISFSELQRVNRFARYWDMIGNSGRFPNTLPLILNDNAVVGQAFTRFILLSDLLYQRADSTWKIALKRLFEFLYPILIDDLNVNAALAETALQRDFSHAKLKGILVLTAAKPADNVSKIGIANKRQRQHL